MKTIFQSIFAILAALSVVAAFFMGVYWDFLYAFIGVAAALFFFVLTMFVKYGNPFRRDREPRTDFMNSEEENARIRKTFENEGDNPKN